MVTCYLRYVIDPFKIKEFEHYAKLWISLVENSEASITVIFYPMEAPIILLLHCSLFLASQSMSRTGKKLQVIKNVKLQ